jgi:bifunctional non-homologous end joining protein LigD
MSPKITGDDIVLQLAEARSAAFTKEGWGFELKYDGFRMLAERIDGRVRLLLRRGREASKQFPEIVQALVELPTGDFILDGEVVIQDAEGHPIFQRLLKRSTLTGSSHIAAASRADPALYYAFDVLMLDGQDFRELPLSSRKELLLHRFQKSGAFLTVDLVETQGEALLEMVKAKRLEGIMCKRLDAPYRGGRSEAWYKVPLKQVADFAVVGFADDFGALYLATYNGHDFVYAGKVGSGFTPAVASSVQGELEALRVKAAPFIGEIPTEPEACFVAPKLVVEVRYKNWPLGLAIREPAFLRFRPDKLAQECPTPRGGYAPSTGEQSAEPVRPVSNMKKILFPGEGITKGDVVNYYEAMAPTMLKYLRDRPLLMTRYPDGIAGKSFFQKQKPLGAPDFVRTVEAYNADEGRTLEQIVCDDENTLHWCASLAALPLHIPAARVAQPAQPDWLTIDFDPKEASFADVKTLALGLRSLCDELGLSSFCKTSGSSGLHVFVALQGALDQSGAQQLAQVLASLLIKRFPTLGTMERVVKKRLQKVYLDTGQNGEGKVIAAPYCIRALAGAPVSMPLRWNEVEALKSARDFTIHNALEKLKHTGDEFAELMTVKVALGGMWERLKAVM